MAWVLERNISRGVRARLQGPGNGGTLALSDLVARHLPWLPPDFTAFFAEGALTLTAGAYPFSVPTEPVRAAIAEIGLSRSGGSDSATVCGWAW